MRFQSRSSEKDLVFGYTSKSNAKSADILKNLSHSFWINSDMVYKPQSFS